MTAEGRAEAERLADAVAKGMKDSRLAAAQAGEDMEFLRHQISRLQQERDAADRLYGRCIDEFAETKTACLEEREALREEVGRLRAVVNAAIRWRDDTAYEPPPVESREGWLKESWERRKLATGALRAAVCLHEQAYGERDTVSLPAVAAQAEICGNMEAPAAPHQASAQPSADDAPRYPKNARVAAATVFVEPPHLEENIAGGFVPCATERPSADDVERARELAARIGYEAQADRDFDNATKIALAALTAATARGRAVLLPVVDAAREVVRQADLFWEGGGSPAEFELATDELGIRIRALPEDALTGQGDDTTNV